MIEADSGRMHTHAVALETPQLWELTAKYGYHFSSLFVIVILMALGMTAFLAVFWSIVVAFGLSFLQPETRLTSVRALAAGTGLAVVLYALGRLGVANIRFSNACFWGMMFTVSISAVLVLWRHLRGALAEQPQASAAGASAMAVGTSGVGAEDSRFLLALEAGGKGALSIAATTATAGIIVSVVTLTGLGLKISGIIVNLSGGYLFLTILYAAIAVWVLGLAVPVTASYIIAAVMIVPALTEVGVNEAAAHMFIFYYSVLADVSPPTALAPFAAAALTGGNPFRTTIMAWKYCLPAFLVPFMITLSPEGASLLMIGAPLTIGWTLITACLAVAALAVAFGGWFLRQANVAERLMMGLGGLALLYADTRSDVIGLALILTATVFHLTRVRRAAALTQPRHS